MSEKISFAYEIKQEISFGNPSARHCKIAMLAGVLSCASISYNKDGLSLVTENGEVAKKVLSLMTELLLPSLSKPVPSGKVREEKERSALDVVSFSSLVKGAHNDKVRVEGKDAMERLSGLLKLPGFEEEKSRVLETGAVDLSKSCCKRSYIMGCFMGGGSLSDPTKSYHFEIVARTEEQAELLNGFLNEFEVRTKVLQRKGFYVVYAKDAESIASVLLVMNATNALMKFENIRINKQVRNSINRGVNFEASNLGKTGIAGEKQLRDIALIEKKIGLSSLDDHLLEVARLRMDNPDSSLKELSAVSDGLSKSCINHRLRRIGEIARGLAE